MNQQPDTKPGFYYVSVVRSNSNDGRGTDWRPLRGPFVNDHVGALAAVDAARSKACEFDPRGHWYAYGTVRSDTDLGPGILDRLEAA